MNVPEAAQLIKDGEVVAFPTETVYGLGANAFSADAVEKIYALKDRPLDNPCIVHIADKSMLADVVREVPQQAEALIREFWPGPLTIVARKAEKIPSVVTAGLATVAVRMPDNDIALALIRTAGVPIAAPSANLAGRPSPTKAEHVLLDFPNVALLDGGDSVHGVESTVVALDHQPRVLRLGAITLEELRRVLPSIIVARQDPARPESPGMKHKHYAPSRPLVLFRDLETMRAYVQGKDVVVLCREEFSHEFSDHPVVTLGNSDEEMAHLLYDRLRTELLGDELCVLGVPPVGIGSTIMDRLERAATKTL